MANQSIERSCWFCEDWEGSVCHLLRQSKAPPTNQDLRGVSWSHELPHEVVALCSAYMEKAGEGSADTAPFKTEKGDSNTKPSGA